MKKIITLLLAMAMLLCLAACGTETTKNKPGVSYDASALEDLLESMTADNEANATKEEEHNSDETEHTDATVPEDDPAPDATPDDGEDTDQDTDTSGISPEFKATMDEYEAFFDEYVEFMTEYQEADNVISMMGEYASMMTQYAETMAALEEIDEDELSDEEALYYAEVMLRIDQKLLSIA